MQRKGVRDDHPDAKTIEDHVRAALEAPFFLAQEIELPPALDRAVHFMADTPANTIKISGQNKCRTLGQYRKVPSQYLNDGDNIPPTH